MSLTVTLNVPAYLVGRRVEQMFDIGRSGLPQSSAPTGTLGSTITLPMGLVNQALSMGFTYVSWVAG